MTDRLTELEIALAHQERLSEDLSEIVRDHADRLTLAEGRIAALLQRLATLEAAGPTDAPPADTQPPHW